MARMNMSKNIFTLLSFIIDTSVLHCTYFTITHHKFTRHSNLVKHLSTFTLHSAYHHHTSDHQWLGFNE